MAFRPPFLCYSSRITFFVSTGHPPPSSTFGAFRVWQQGLAYRDGESTKPLIIRYTHAYVWHNEASRFQRLKVLFFSLLKNGHFLRPGDFYLPSFPSSSFLPKCLLHPLSPPPPLLSSSFGQSHHQHRSRLDLFAPWKSPPPFSKGALGAISQPRKKVVALVYKYIEG